MMDGGGLDIRDWGRPEREPCNCKSPEDYTVKRLQAAIKVAAKREKTEAAEKAARDERERNRRIRELESELKRLKERK